MKYMGSKSRLAKELLPIILKDRRPDQWYVEPFLGGANMFDKVANPRIGSDTHYYLIMLLKAMKNGWIPPKEITEEEYKLIQDFKYKNIFDACLVGYAGFQLSYGGKWFGGYRRDKEGKRDYSFEAYNNTMKQAPLLEGAIFEHTSYLYLEIPPKSLIYCDPPYAGTTGYKDKFDSDTFWEWCKLMKELGHTLFLSEYNAPEGFKCVWSKEVYNTLDKDTGSKFGVEKLFIPE